MGVDAGFLQPLRQRGRRGVAQRDRDLLARGAELGLGCNVANSADVARCMAAARAAFGRLDIAVNNAGIGITGYPLPAGMIAVGCFRG